MAGQTQATVTVATPKTLLLPMETLQLAITTTTPGVDVLNTIGGVRLDSDVATKGIDADPVLTETSGPGRLTATGANAYTLALGSVSLLSIPSAALSVLNGAGTYGDTLRGTWSMVSGSGFKTTGTGGAASIAPGASGAALRLTPQGVTGNFSETFAFTPTETNASGYTGSLPVQTLTVIDTVMPFLASGTRIATPNGQRLVEKLATGDLVRTASGEAARIVWAGRRTIDCTGHPEPKRIWPLRVAAHAFGPGLPARALLLSPDHAIFVRSVLIPVKHLENDTTITRVPIETITYHHIELARHDILLANGLPAESYLDDGRRDCFEGGAVIRLHPDFASDNRLR